jgi:hypothetical protein
LMACIDLLGGSASGRSRAVPCGVVVVGCGFLVFIGASGGNLVVFMIFCSWAIVYLLHVAAASMAVWCRGVRDKRRSGPSRTSMLYRHYFGVNGTLFVWKVAALQLMTIVLQSTAKIELLAMAVAMEGAVTPALEPLGVLIKPMFWIFVGALALNTVYPAVLLHSKRRGLQRNAVASIDMLLNLIYLFAFGMSMLAADGYSHTLPTVPHLYVSQLSPLVRVVTTTRAIETAAEERRLEATGLPQAGTDAKRAADRQRLPRWAAVAFLLLAALGCGIPFLLLGSRDRYPFSTGDECRPCKCNAETMLESCTIPARLGVRYLCIDGKGLRGFAPGAFRARGLSILRRLDVSHNNISMLQAGVFDGLHGLHSLVLSANPVRMLEAGAFDGVPMLATLIMRDSPLAALRTGDFAGLDNLHNLFLDGSDELRLVQPGVFADTPRVVNVWVGGSAINCTRLGLPGAATCFDDVSCDAELIGLVGNGMCDPDKRGHNTAKCAWDGGDCL